MALATLEGVTISRCSVTVPAWGLWWADVDLVDAAELAGAVTLVLADVTASGAIVSGGAAHGRAAYRVVGGAGGWGREIGRRAYNNDLGVKLSTVAGDAAREVGETLGDVPTTKLGTHYARRKAPASHTLNAIAERAWYVDFNGVTRFGARAESTYTGIAPRVRQDPGAQCIELATEEIATLVPGVIVDNALPATDVEYVLDATRLTVRVYSGAQLSRELEAWRKLFDALDPRRAYRTAYEYRVVSQSGERLNVQPVRVATGMPDLARVPVRPGMAGERATVTPGSRVVVAFLDGDPSRPYVSNHDEPGSTGWMPLELDFGDAPRLPAARVTDPIVAGPFGGTITGPGSLRVKIGA